MSLRELGLDAETERTYRLLLAMPSPTFAALAAASGEDAEVLTTRIGRLVELGLVRRSDERIAVPDPTAAVGSLIERVEDDVIARYRRVSATRSEVAGLNVLRAAGVEAVQEVERITDLAALRDKVEELSFFTRTSLWALQTGGPVSEDVLDAARPLDLRGLRRGIDMRIVRERRVLDDAANRRYLFELAAQGAQVRVLPAAAHRILLMDDEVAVVPIDQQQVGRGALVVRHPVLVAGFRDVFERAWAEAVDIHDVDADGAPADEVSPAERALLGQLLRGVTDEVAARELAMSTRHLRRQLTRLYDRLGVQNRFADGAEAARRGWV